MRDRRYVIGIALVVIIILFNLPFALSRSIRSSFREMLSPFQNMVSGLFYRVDGGLDVMFQGGKPMAEKERFLTEIAQLGESIRRYEALEQENAELRDKLEFAARAPHQMVICEVIGRGEASGWWETVRLNKGRNHGIEPGMAVMSRDGLVGEVITISARTSDVLLISDPNCRVSARFARTGSFGIVRGGGAAVVGDPVLDMCYPNPVMQADFVAKHMRIRKGDSALTSGLGGIYPPGLLIGFVDSTAMHQSGLYQCAAIVPAADLLNLRYVFVIKSGGKVAPAGGAKATPAIGEGRVR